MFALKDFIPDYRFDKFKKRNWKVTVIKDIQPVCYRSLNTASLPKNVDDIKEINPEFYKVMVVQKNFKVTRI